MMIVAGFDLAGQLSKAGIIPADCRDVQIHIPCDGLVTIDAEVVTNEKQVAKLVEILGERFVGYQIAKVIIQVVPMSRQNDPSPNAAPPIDLIDRIGL